MKLAIFLVFTATVGVFGFSGSITLVEQFALQLLGLIAFMLAIRHA